MFLPFKARFDDSSIKIDEELRSLEVLVVKSDDQTSLTWIWPHSVEISATVFDGLQGEEKRFSLVLKLALDVAPHQILCFDYFLVFWINYKEGSPDCKDIKNLDGQINAKMYYLNSLDVLISKMWFSKL